MSNRWYLEREKKVFASPFPRTWICLIIESYPGLRSNTAKSALGLRWFTPWRMLWLPGHRLSFEWSLQITCLFDQIHVVSTLCFIHKQIWPLPLPSHCTSNPKNVYHVRFAYIIIRCRETFNWPDISWHVTTWGIKTVRIPQRLRIFISSVQATQQYWTLCRKTGSVVITLDMTKLACSKCFWYIHATVWHRDGSAQSF